MAIACGLAGWVGSVVVLDTLDIQPNDYHFQVGPVYFNFQGDNSDPYNSTWTVEHVY